jgi:hypothetical protein
LSPLSPFLGTVPSGFGLRHAQVSNTHTHAHTHTHAYTHTHTHTHTNTNTYTYTYTRKPARREENGHRRESAIKKLKITDEVDKHEDHLFHEVCFVALLA